MARIVLVRLGLMVPLFAFVTFLVFLLVDLAPGDAARELAGQNATEQEVEAVRDRLGLNDPVVVQYGSWLASAATGDLGESLTRRVPVSELITSKLAPTVSLGAFAMTFSVIVGSVLGVGAAVHQGRLFDRLATVFAAGGVAVPSFFVGLILVVTFSLDRSWLPATGYTPLAEGAGEWFRHLLLPAVALGWFPAAEMSRHTRSAVVGVLERDYIITAWSKGLRWPTIIRRHLLRNAGIPIVTVLGARIAAVLGGTMVIESVFGIEGVGRLTVQSVLARDIPTILGVVSFTTLVVLFVNLLVDLSYRILDPRTRR